VAKVLFDCDGVLLGLTPHLLSWLRNGIKEEELTEWDFFAAFTPEDKRRARQLMSSSWFWKTAQPIEGAVLGVQLLREAGHHVKVVTSPWRGCRTWGADRYDWLEKHFGIHPDQVSICHEKWDVSGDVFIDDKPVHVEDWVAAHPDKLAFLFRRPCNKRANRALPRFTWDKVDSLLELLDVP